jgi:hypothetical protein
MVKAFAADIGKGQMGEIDVLNCPNGLVIGSLVGALPEECQLKSKGTALGCRQISRVVPPLGSEIRMLEMIAGKGIAVPRQGLAIDHGNRQKLAPAESHSS